MKTQTKIVLGLSFIILFCLFFYINSNIIENNEIKNRQNITKVEYLNTDLNTTTLDLDINNSIDKEANKDVELIENNTENKEVSLYAEEILYPEEYDFSFFSTDLNDIEDKENNIIKKIGKPIKLSDNYLLNLYNLNTDDEIIFFVNNNKFNFFISSIDIINNDLNNLTYVLNSKSDDLEINYNLYFSVINSTQTILNLTISYKGGIYEKVILKNGIGFFYTSIDFDKEFHNQCYKNHLN